MIESSLPFLLLLPLLFGVILVPGIGVARPRWVFPIAISLLAVQAAVAVAGLAVVMRVGTISYQVANWAPPIGIELRVDLLSAFVAMTIAIIGFLVGLFSCNSVPREMPGRETPFYGLMFILLLGLTGMVVTGDLFNLYVFLEISSLSGYALMAIGHRKAPVAAYRYLLLGTVGASFYLIGVGYLYLLTGSLNLIDVAQLIQANELGGNPALLMSLVLMVAGLGLKMALFPMHLWLPDAYTYASSTATALIAPVMTKVSAYALIRVLFFVYDARLVHDFLPVGTAITWFALAGVVAGSVMAIAQKDVKRMLAYSSVAQVAYIGVGIGLGNRLALVGAMLHILNHAAMKSCLFLVVGGVQLQTGVRTVAGFDGLGRRMPWTCFALTLAAMAMIGVPPTNGFFSKWYLVLGGIAAQQWAVVAIVILSSLLTAVYFFRLLNRVYAGNEEGRDPNTGADRSKSAELPWMMRLPIVALGLSLLLLGLGNNWLVEWVLLPALPPSVIAGTP